MKILHFGQIDTGGMASMLGQAINEYTEHEYRLVTFNESRGFDSDIVFNRELWGAFNMRPSEYWHHEFMRLVEWADTVIVSMGVVPGAGNADRKDDDADFKINDVPFPAILDQMKKKVFAYLPGSTSLRRNYPFFIKLCKMRGWPVITPQPDIYRNVSPKMECHYIPILLTDTHPRYRNSLFDFVSKNKFNFDTLFISHSPTDRRIKNTDELIAAVNRANEVLGEDRVKIVLIENCGQADSLISKKQSFVAFDQMQSDGYYCLSSVENMTLGLVNIVRLNQYAIDLITKDIGEFPPWEIVQSEDDLYNVIVKLYNEKDKLYDRMKASYDFARDQWSIKKNIHKLIGILNA